MAEAVFRHQVAAAGLADHFVVDSAGTGGWHVGERPHHATLAILAEHGVDPGDQRARRLEPADLASFHYIAAMDRENLSEMSTFTRTAPLRVRLLLDYAPAVATREVPDPYYSGGFEHVYQLVSAGCSGLLAHIREREGM
jgi:protein-tyrosine phosphatase